MKLHKEVYEKLDIKQRLTRNDLRALIKEELKAIQTSDILKEEITENDAVKELLKKI